MWEVPSLKKVFEGTGDPAITSELRGLCWAPDGKRFAAQAGDGLYVWEVP